MNARTPPVVSSLRPFNAPIVERTALQNGIDLLVVPRRSLPVVDINVILRGGGSLDTPADAGRASLTAELLDEGTGQRSALEISNQIELLGAEMDLRAGWDACFIAAHGLSDRFDALTELLADVLLQPAFPQDEFNRKQEERLHALAQEKDEPRIVAVKALNRAVYGDHHPFGRPLAGTEPTVGRLTVESLVEYYRASFAPSAAHIVVVGDVEPATALSVMEKHFGSWIDRPAAPGRNGSAPDHPRTIYFIDRPGAAQSEVRVGHVAPERGTPDYFALQVLNTILGGSFKSRLNMTLRERKGFTYGASSALALRRSSGLFSAGAAVFTDNTAETVSIMVNELEHLHDQPVSAEELQRARNYLALGYMRNFETTGDIAGRVAELALYDQPLTLLDEYPARIEQVDAALVRNAAREYLLPNQLSIVVVGDGSRVLESLHRLELGPIVVWEAE